MRIAPSTPLAVLLAVLAVVPGGGVPAQSTVVVANLRCEYRTNPIGIDEARPRLGWVLTAGRRDEGQTAYQVVVATSEALLAHQQGDLWDSGKVASANSVHIVYDGKPLRSRASCYWKVRVWDREGRASPWSAVARWEMALLEASDWAAVWLNDGKANPSSAADFYRDDPSPLFRCIFTLPARVSRARLYISGLGYYEAFLNAARVGDQVLDPGWTMYGRRVFYSTYDVTSQLKAGRNCLGVTLGNGWYNPLPLLMWGNLNLREHLTVGRPRFIAQLEVEFADGSRQTIASDSTWRVADGPLVFNSVYLGEVYDARLALDSWNDAGFDDSTWRRAAIAAEPVGVLRAQPQPPITIRATVAPVAVTEPLPGVFVFDMGRNLAGWASIGLAAPRGTRITLRYGELLNADGTLNPMTSVAGQIKGIRKTKDGVAEKIGGPGAPDVAWQTDTYIARGIGREHYTPRFTFHGFRYVEVTGYPGRPTVDAVHGLQLSADVRPAGWFASSSDLLNRMQEMTTRTFLSNLFSVQSDCPHREKFGYGGDIVATSDAMMLNFDMAQFYEKAANDWADSVRDDGMLTDTAPFVGIQYCGIGWAMAHPTLQSQLYRYYGDRQIVERQYPTSCRWLDLEAARNPTHVMRAGLGDHEALTDTPQEALVTPMFAQAATLMARLGATLGRDSDASRFGALADDTRRAFQEVVLKPSSAARTHPTQSAVTFALEANLLQPADRLAALQWLVDDIRVAQKGHFSTGILGTKFALDLLSREGYADLVYDVVRGETFPGWGYMLAGGATTLWEHWAGSTNTYSQNHPMFGSVSQWLFNWLGGIQPGEDASGFDHIAVRPQPVQGIDWVRCTYESIRGTIAVKWARTPTAIEWDITIPVNTLAEVFIPAASLEDVTEGVSTRVAAGRAAGVHGARLEKGNAVFTVGSGTYHFTSKIPTRRQP